MGKTKNIKEHDVIQQLKVENQQLKRQLSKLRKQISRLDLDRYQNIRELLEYQEDETKNLTIKSKRQILLEKWQCYKCSEGYLRLIILSRPDGAFYFRSCKECGHKTKLQKYTDGVDGILD